MYNFKYKARTMHPQGVPKVYFCCHPDDFDKYYDIISDTILSVLDCCVFYCDNPQPEDESFLFDLSQMHIFVVPVTKKTLYTPNSAMDSEISYALQLRIPVLPIILESGLEEIAHNKLHDTVCIKWYADTDIDFLAEQLKTFSLLYFRQEYLKAVGFFYHTQVPILKKLEQYEMSSKNCGKTPWLFT